jgi:hypothetical protein
MSAITRDSGDFPSSRCHHVFGSHRARQRKHGHIIARRRLVHEFLYLVHNANANLSGGMRPGMMKTALYLLHSKLFAFAFGLYGSA